MKYKYLFIHVPVLLIAAAVLSLAARPAVKTDRDTITAADSVRTIRDLSDDPATAKKELRQARAALARLTPKAPYIVIDTHANRIQLRTVDTVLFDASCSTGSGGELVDSVSGRHWTFDTPRGVFKVNSKLEDPWWRKPDWAFIEDNEQIPTDEDERLDPRMMGEYAIGFGDGYFIHGTIYERLLGINVTHGCVRVGSDDLKKLYYRVGYGTHIYIF
nr:L,D-transpeptidase [candidate division Zixibacteria bacterium]